jgi:glyoxylase-like metal-dependent hydrolase (beta-lactamase superfamily II)
LEGEKMNNRTYHFTIGEIDCLAISDASNQVFDPIEIYEFPASKVEVEEALKEYQIKPERIPSDWICLLLELDGKRILIDTGNGPGGSPGTGKLLEHLQLAGIQLESIFAVIPSHVHYDHIAGMLTGDNKPVFPDAHNYVGRADWDCWHMRKNQEKLHLDAGLMEYFKAAELYLPHLEKNLEIIDDGFEILPGIRVITAPGHTPGNMVVHIQSNNEQLMFVGDLFYLPVQVNHPEWYTQYDFNPEIGVESRKIILKRAAEEHILVLPAHSPLPGLGYVMPTETGWRWQKIDLPQSASK